MSTFAPCGMCRGQIVVGVFDPITVPVVDEDGFPTLAPDGGVVKITLQLPRHRCDTPLARSTFDPTGLAPASCSHGLKEHPNGVRSPLAVSWIRSKYLFTNLQCVVCRGEEVPSDFCTPRNMA